MSRQADRRGEDLQVRVSWLEADLDRVDERFVETAGAVTHAKNNLGLVLQNLERRLEQSVEKLEAKVERIEHETDEKVDGNRKVMVGVLVSTLSVAIAIVAQVLIMRGGS